MGGSGYRRKEWRRRTLLVICEDGDHLVYEFDACPALPLRLADELGIAPFVSLN